MLLYLITYDIPCDKRRKKVSDLLEGYGTRVQYSVFECCLEKDQYDRLRKRLRKHYKQDLRNDAIYSALVIWRSPTVWTGKIALLS
jgi:CRISPR-associated endonuclease Cas2